MNTPAVHKALFTPPEITEVFNPNKHLFPHSDTDLLAPFNLEGKTEPQPTQKEPAKDIPIDVESFVDALNQNPLLANQNTAPLTGLLETEQDPMETPWQHELRTVPIYIPPLSLRMQPFDERELSNIESQGLTDAIQQAIQNLEERLNIQVDNP